MSYESKKTVTVNLRLSPALHRQLEAAARNAGKPLESTIKSLLWIALGAYNLRARNLVDRIDE